MFNWTLPSSFTVVKDIEAKKTKTFVEIHFNLWKELQRMIKCWQKHLIISFKIKERMTWKIDFYTFP